VKSYRNASGLDTVWCVKERQCFF